MSYFKTFAGGKKFKYTKVLFRKGFQNQTSQFWRSNLWIFLPKKHYYGQWTLLPTLKA